MYSSYVLAFHCKEDKEAIRKLGALEQLVMMLDGKNPNLQLTATTCLLNCSLCNQNQILLRNLGGIEKLLKLTTPNYEEQVRINALVTLSNYSVNDDNKVTVGELGIDSLLQLIPNSPEYIQEKIAGILWNCSTIEANRKKLEELNGLDVLGKVIPTNNLKMKRNLEGVINRCLGVPEPPSESKEFKHVVYEVSTFFRKEEQ